MESSLGFLMNLDKDRTIYIANIPCNRRVWLEKPKAGVPERKGNRGPYPEKEQVLEGESSPMEVQKIAEIGDLEWHRVFLRDTERKEKNYGVKWVVCESIQSMTNYWGRKYG